jgi:predicted ATP-grasp superfamily ATP-dependent carboligase
MSSYQVCEKISAFNKFSFVEAEKLAEQAKSWCEKIDIKLDKMMVDEKLRKQKELEFAKHESDHQIKLNRVFCHVKADLIGTFWYSIFLTKFLFSSRGKLRKST